MAEKEKKDESPDNALLFRQAMDGVTPLPPTNRMVTVRSFRYTPPRNRTSPSSAIVDTLSDYFPGNDLPTEFLRPGMPRMILHKLRRGQWQIQDTLDLHGFYSHVARRLLLGFLHDATGRRLRFVCVIHGKGWQTGGREGLLKSLVRHWLPQCSEVLAFCEAPQNAGGGGAVWIILKTGTKNKNTFG